jgi:hypothetical protein
MGSFEGFFLTNFENATSKGLQGPIGVAEGRLAYRERRRVFWASKAIGAVRRATDRRKKLLFARNYSQYDLLKPWRQKIEDINSQSDQHTDSADTVEQQ